MRTAARSMVSRLIGKGGRATSGVQRSNVRQLAMLPGGIESVTDDVNIRYGESGVIRAGGRGAGRRLVEQRADPHLARTALLQEVLGEAERETRFQDVIDQQHVAAAHLVDDVAHDPHRAGGLGAGAVLSAFGGIASRSACAQGSGPLEQVRNAYDNTIAYTDHVLAKAIDWLDTTSEKSAVVVEATESS